MTGHLTVSNTPYFYIQEVKKSEGTVSEGGFTDSRHASFVGHAPHIAIW